jgi:predicted DNA-binding transcriptional regulator AlpA
MTDGDEFIGVSEIAQMLGVERNSAWRYTRRSDFPECVSRPASGPIWRKRDVAAWAAESLPLKRGRPRRDLE